ncbi:restriction endonuclease [Mycobacterium sp. CVI_P3]|uniref:Restriction endonuclease n=1 Tax=Mycobacterium pinniadriaticum TaxID=2994102 RepID=A0ABT3SPA1_9MYCO|nr:restriction endonuclease [Mycobacterium pinniadriaticum]MCX2934939.1 restriction endonuclease [Mycobacterium pinniadriaticum]MCX2941361.1 restriction endonuclease [Mycobacterium pinniadriaticum]
MTIPDYQTLLRPVLASLGDGQVHRSRDVIDSIADELNLSPEERAARVPSGQKRIDNRVAWTITYLNQAGLIERPGRGLVKISEEGRSALDKYPQRIDNKILEAYPAFIEFRDRKRGRGSDEDVPAPKPLARDDEVSTPNDLVERAVRANRVAVESEVLAAALRLSATGFEELVVRLLDKMGYGRAGSVERTTASGDAGIDGIIHQDPLGLDRIYMQAKRYAEDRAVDRPKIHEFAGALLGKQGDRGVFITTSRFTTGAHQEAERINARIELIDGARLSELLVKYGVGVQEEHSVTLYKLDEDFFDSI